MNKPPQLLRLYANYAIDNSLINRIVLDCTNPIHLMRKQLKHIYDHHLDDFEEFMVLKDFSKRTVTAYMQAVYQFLDLWDEQLVELPTPQNRRSGG